MLRMKLRHCLKLRLNSPEVILVGLTTLLDLWTGWTTQKLKTSLRNIFNLLYPSRSVTSA